MPLSRGYLDYVLEQLADLGAVRARRMFGAAGLYCDELFFGIVSGDTLYLRADERTRAEYVARGMHPFRPYPDRPQVSMSYYAIPAEVLEDAEELARWGREALAAARVAPSATRRRGPSGPRRAARARNARR
jgi:DNA transformation protein and related proteins